MNTYQRIFLKLNIIEDLFQFHKISQDKDAILKLFYNTLLQNIHILEKCPNKNKLHDFLYSVYKKTTYILEKNDKCEKLERLMKKFQKYYETNIE